ncbi:MAG: hypothetical protein EPN48_17065 [Microbacteriaceae bacterium]|nr:MAG: hypothetical protein EPN48_17065 [Microbacteriaceae bacterium]
MNALRAVMIAFLPWIGRGARPIWAIDEHDSTLSMGRFEEENRTTSSFSTVGCMRRVRGVPR